ncbi:sodium-dependent transporter [Paramaledivibacter caminithermalis]|jgi:NSS family neurotransmitter:Na+ symporter|uniref:Transporter n=1 Tax=Paramaledivibacter caminithermalis (strain DSM 15212 / CIP 107654 / DViRD3) TaxID=1121301 RepID=A0A1M6KAB9_PARC5|nr:sodium-dependent transporter [Paramaledivibacter caminithermalis]SHJ55925.1 neurotransmitter:Na+ symporter, NSS family [Paramaledivibacter caminithermalis DSM 15212]
MESNNLQKRDGFGSKLGIIAAAAGSAIGLGNIWKFPYITGENGGAAFIIVYLICIALIGFPVMLSEFIIGRRAQKNAIGSFKKLAPGTPWFLTGWMGVVAAFFILAFYGVVAGWCLDYIVKAITNSFAGQTTEQIGNAFTGLISNPWQPVIWQIIFMALTAFIVLAGVKDGIEKYAKILMPLLLGIIIILDIRAITLPGSGAGLAFLFKPDFSKLSAQGVLTALGHAFFSLSLGMGTMITYGSYIQKKENLADTAIQVTIADTLIALLAGVAIFPAVFAFGIEPGAGPGLVFVTLPNVFQQMPGGYFFGLLFFILLTVAALTSSISILEVVVAYVVEDMNINRKKAAVVAALLITILGIPCSLAMGPMANIKLLGGRNFFDTLDYIASNWLLPLGGLFISIFVGWILGKENVEDEVTCGGVKISYLPFFMFLARFIAPIAIAIVFLNGIGVLKF